MSRKKIKNNKSNNFTMVTIEDPRRVISCKRNPKKGYKCKKCGHKQKTIERNCDNCGGNWFK